MSFEATIFIQGVGNYRLLRDADGKERGVDVLFPDGAGADEAGLKDPEGRTVCDHHAVVQVDPAAIAGRPDPRLWESGRNGSVKLSITQHRVEVDTDSSVAFEHRRDDRRGDDGIFGLPRLDPFLSAAGWQDAAIDDQSPLLTSQIRFEHGVLGPESDFLGSWEVPPRRWSRRWDTQLLSSVMKVELGEIERLTFRLHPLGGRLPGDAASRFEEVRLRPSHGAVLDVWIRHYCELDWPPRPHSELIAASLQDRDFVLNYALVRDLQSRRCDGLPVPRVSRSWIGGGPIGGDPSLCQGTETGGGG